LIAAQSAGRVCFAIEIDPLFVDLAIRRWQAFTGEKAMRESDGTHFDVLEQGIQPGEAGS
jgi:DNA modification methylase